MKLIDEIIDILSSENFSLENALIKTKILLYKMGEKSLLEWVNQELNGYKNTNDLPDYRIIEARVVGTFKNYSTRYTNHPIPIRHLNDEELDFFTNVNFFNSISTLEDLSKSENILYSPIDIEFSQLLSKNLDKSFVMENINREMSKAQILGILTQIRSRLLDFILELSEKFPDEIDDKDIKSKSKEIGIKELFNNAIFGDNVTIIVGDNNKSNNHQVKNNFDNLVKRLQSHNLNFQDFKELEKSIEKDKSELDNEKKELGENVKNWVQKISTKVGDKLAIDSIIENIHDFYGWLI